MNFQLLYKQFHEVTLKSTRLLCRVTIRSVELVKLNQICVDEIKASGGNSLKFTHIDIHRMNAGADNFQRVLIKIIAKLRTIVRI